jgi:hypothetical protein
MQHADLFSDLQGRIVHCRVELVTSPGRPRSARENITHLRGKTGRTRADRQQPGYPRSIRDTEGIQRRVCRRNVSRKAVDNGSFLATHTNTLVESFVSGRKTTPGN